MKRAAQTIGASESRAWLEHTCLDPNGERHWYVEVALESDEPGTRLELNIYPDEWGFVFRSGNRVSSIRITDRAFVHGSDDHQLLAHVPALESVPTFLGTLEERFGVTFIRHRAVVRSTLVRASSIVKPWLVFA